ncbi:phage polarity suppression protein [Cronobacter sakazakii]
MLCSASPIICRKHYIKGATDAERLTIQRQDHDIITDMRFRPEAASRDDNREKFTPAQYLSYTHRRAELAAQ